MNLQEQADPTSQATLESWKEIAAYLRRDAKTARKWEKEEGLPVHRHTHKSRSSVYAYPGEIDRWRATRKVVAEPPPPVPIWRRLLTPTFAVTLAACLVMVGNGVRPQLVEAQQGQIRTLACSGEGCDGQISPDGKSLVVSLGGNPRLGGSIGIRDLATKQVRTLAEGGPDVHLCCVTFSADGSRVAYHRMVGRPTPETDLPQEVIVVNVDGTKPRTVYRDGYSITWSADGKRLLVGGTDRPNGLTSLRWVNLATSAVQRLPIRHANLDNAKVSPDGKYVAFNGSKDDDTPANAYIAASDGSGETLVSPSAAYQEPLEWTADGKYLVFAQVGTSVSLWAAPVASGKVQGPAINTHAEFQGDFNSLSGVARSGAIYYRTVSSTSDIFTATMDPATGKVTSGPTPVPVDRTGANALPRWAPDSRQLMYNWVYPLTTGTSEVRELHVYSLGTGKEQRVAAQAKLAPGAFCWSSDGTSIFFNSGENPRRPEVARFGLGTNQIAPLFPGTTPFALRSCSSSLAAGLDGSALKVRNLQSGSEKEIYKFDPGTHPPVLSHDGRNIAFVVPNAGASVLRIVSSEGGAPRDVVTAIPPAELQTYWGVAWSHDDRFLYFARRTDGKSPYELMRVAAAGGTPEYAGLKVEDIRDLDIAPDGTRIAFSIGAVNRPEIWALRGFLPK